MRDCLQVQALESSLGQPGLLQQVSDRRGRLEAQLAPRPTAPETAATTQRRAAIIATEDTVQQLSARITAVESAASQQQLQHLAERERAEAELRLQQRVKVGQHSQSALGGLAWPIHCVGGQAVAAKGEHRVCGR